MTRSDNIKLLQIQIDKDVNIWLYTTWSSTKHIRCCIIQNQETWCLLCICNVHTFWLLKCETWSVAVLWSNFPTRISWKLKSLRHVNSCEFSAEPLFQELALIFSWRVGLKIQLKGSPESFWGWGVVWIHSKSWP